MTYLFNKNRLPELNKFAIKMPIFGQIGTIFEYADDVSF
jgi:hypothetical protein